MPPCHHWSWSSMWELSDHFTTVRRRVLRSPGRTTPVRSNSLARWESLPMPTACPSTSTISTLSAAPTWSTILRPAQSAGMSMSRSWTPVGLAAGDAGGWCGHGIVTLV